MMNQATADTILHDPLVHAASIGPMPNGKYAVYIGTHTKTEDGIVRPVVILTSDGMFKTVVESQQYGDSIIRDIKLGLFNVMTDTRA